MLNPRKLSQDPTFRNLLPRDKFVLLRSPLDELDPAQRNGTASLDAVAAALATRFAVGGGPQWVLGNDYKEGAFTYDKGLTYRTKQDVASSQTAPSSDPDNFEVVGPVPRYAIVTLPNAQAARAARTVTPGRLDGITGDWNAAGLDETVYVHGVWFDAYHKLGVVYDATGASRLVEVDVAAGTYAKLTGSQLTADQVAALQVPGANATNQFVLSTDLSSLTSRFYGLSDLLTLLQRYIIRWDQEKTVTLNQDFEGRLRYTSGQAFAFTSGTYAAGIIRLSADDYGRRGDLAAVRIMVGSKDLVFEAGAAEAFHSSGGPRTLPALAGYQYIFHLVRPDPNSTAGSYWVVHTTPTTSTSGGTATYFTGTYTAPAAGAQTITASSLNGLDQAAKIISVGVRGTLPSGDPTLYELPTYTTGPTPQLVWSFDASTHTLPITAAAGLDQGDVLEIAWLTGGTLTPGQAYTAGSGIDITGNVISTKTVLRPALRVSSGVPYPGSTAQPAPGGQFLKVTGYSQVEREVGSTPGTGWDAANQQYIVPLSGEYQVAAVGQLQPGVSSPSGVFYHIVYVNDMRTRDLFIQACPSNQEYYGGAGTTDLSLDAGDRVDIRYYHSGGAGSQLIQSNVRCAFSIRQLPS